jgi:hypothetical protein
MQLRPCRQAASFAPVGPFRRVTTRDEDVAGGPTKTVLSTALQPCVFAVKIPHVYARISSYKVQI